MYLKWKLSTFTVLGGEAVCALILWDVDWLVEAHLSWLTCQHSERDTFHTMFSLSFRMIQWNMGFHKNCKNKPKKKIFADIPTLSASGQPPSSQFLKSLLCLVLNNYHPVALAHILMRSFEKLILHHIKDNIPASLDHHQYAFRTNRFTKNAVSTTLHNLPEEADWKTQHSGLEYLTLDSGLPHKQTPGSLDWHLHFL